MSGSTITAPAVPSGAKGCTVKRTNARGSVPLASPGHGPGHDQEIIQVGLVQSFTGDQLAEHEEQDVRAGPVVITAGRHAVRRRPDDVLHDQRVELDLVAAEAGAQRRGQPDGVGLGRLMPEASPQSQVKAEMTRSPYPGS